AEGAQDLRDVHGRQRQRLAHVDRARPPAPGPGDARPREGIGLRGGGDGRAVGRGPVAGAMKLCMIGCGEHAASSHGPAQALYAGRHPGVVLAGCADLDPDRAARHRERFGFARSYSDAWAMLEAEHPDAVVLVVPDEATCELATRVLEQGYPLLLEKPPGRTPAELDRMAAAADKGGHAGRPVPHQVAFNRRFAPLVREARDRVASLRAAAPLQHVHYEMARVDRRDP